MTRLRLPAAATLVLLLAGCSPAPAPTEFDVDLGGEPPTAEVEWVDHTTPDGATFEIPADWNVADGEFESTIADATGAVQLTYLPEIGGIGSNCSERYPYEEFDVVELDLPAPPGQTPRFVYRAMEIGGRIAATLGLAGFADGEDGLTCGFFNVVMTGTQQFSFGMSLAMYEGADLSFDSMDDARAYVDTEEYGTLKRILTSFTLEG